MLVEDLGLTIFDLDAFTYSITFFYFKFLFFVVRGIFKIKLRLGYLIQMRGGKILQNKMCFANL